MLVECELNATLYAQRVNECPDLQRDLIKTNDYKDGTLYVLGELLDDEGDRQTSRQIMTNNTDQHFVLFDDIQGSDQLSDIVYKVWTDNILAEISPLSSFIAYKKVLNHIEQKAKFTDDLDYEANRYYYNCIKRIRNFADIGRFSSKIEDNNTKIFLYQTIIHAISAFENFEKAINSIEIQLDKFYPDTIWKCLMCESVNNFHLVNFWPEFRSYCVSIREDLTDEEKEVKFQNFVIFEMFPAQYELSDNVTCVQTINMSDSMIAEAIEIIEDATMNLTLNDMSEYISARWNEQFQSSEKGQFQVIVSKNDYIFPISSSGTIEHATFGAFKCKEFCFIISSIKLNQVPNNINFPLITDSDIDLDNENIDLSIKQVIVSPETEDFDEDIYETISTRNKRAIHTFCVSYSTKLVDTFVVKIAVVEDILCIALMDYQRVGHTDENFDYTFYLEDNEGDIMKIRLKWF